MELFENLKKVKGFIFDVDGVLTDGSIFVNEKGEQLRTFNVKDGFAIRALLEAGFPVAIISGGQSQSVRKRFEYLGVQNIYLDCRDKLTALKECSGSWRIPLRDLLFMGDDLPDLLAMQQTGFPCCPTDASEEVKHISKYISPQKGGQGAVRDVIEKVMKLQGCWPTFL